VSSRNPGAGKPELVEVPRGPWVLRELSAREKLIRNFAYVLFGLITLVTLAVIAEWLLCAPSAPNLLTAKTEDQKAIIDGYRALSDIATAQSMTLFENIVLKSLLPVFTTVMGFLLGRRQQ
jgi:hypothetical protein